MRFLKFLGEEGTKRWWRSFEDVHQGIEEHYEIQLEDEDVTVRIILPDLRYYKNTTEGTLLSEPQWIWLE